MEIDNGVQRPWGSSSATFSRYSDSESLFPLAPQSGLYTSASPRYSYCLCRLRQRLWHYLEIVALFSRRERMFSAELKAAGWFVVHTAGLALICSLHGQDELACASKMHIDAASCTAALAASVVPTVFISQ